MPRPLLDCRLEIPKHCRGTSRTISSAIWLTTSFIQPARVCTRTSPLIASPARSYWSQVVVQFTLTMSQWADSIVVLFLALITTSMAYPILQGLRDAFQWQNSRGREDWEDQSDHHIIILPVHYEHTISLSWNGVEQSGMDCVWNKLWPRVHESCRTGTGLRQLWDIGSSTCIRETCSCHHKLGWQEVNEKDAEDAWKSGSDETTTTSRFKGSPRRYWKNGSTQGTRKRHTWHKWLQHTEWWTQDIWWCKKKLSINVFHIKWH